MCGNVQPTVYGAITDDTLVSVPIGGILAGRGLSALLEAVALAVHFQNMRVVDQPLRAEHFGPLVKGQVDGLSELAPPAPRTPASLLMNRVFLLRDTHLHRDMVAPYLTELFFRSLIGTSFSFNIHTVCTRSSCAIIC